MKKPVAKPRRSPLAAIHETVDRLHRAGVVDQATMREFDALCLAPGADLAPEENGRDSSASTRRPQNG